MSQADEDLLHTFRFKLYFASGTSPSADTVDLCDGAFSECSGLEVTMEPKVIKEGGRNYGPAQRVGQVTFATVVLKRGISRTGEMFNQLYNIATGASRQRLAVRIELQDPSGTPVMTWQLENALPVKFKAADFNAKATELGIEELHLAHEGLTLGT
jgi:phage tail-like protein